MKTMLSLLILGTSLAAFAQTSVTTINKESLLPKTKGVSVNLAHIAIDSIDTVNDYSIRKSSNSLENKLLGVSVGYKDAYAFEGDFGYASTFSILTNTDSKNSSGKYMVYEAAGNAVYPFGSHYNLQGGINISYIGGSAGDGLTFEPGLGIQAGVEANLAGVGILIGYKQLGYNAKPKMDSNAAVRESNFTATIGGLMAQVGYTF